MQALAQAQEEAARTLSERERAAAQQVTEAQELAARTKLAAAQKVTEAQRQAERYIQEERAKAEVSAPRTGSPYPAGFALSTGGAVVCCRLARALVAGGTGSLRRLGETAAGEHSTAQQPLPLYRVDGSAAVGGASSLCCHTGQCKVFGLALPYRDR